MAILDGAEAVYIYQVEAQRSIRMFTQLGAHAPLHCTGVGKVLVAWNPPNQVERLLKGHRFEVFTSTTISSMKQMAIELEQVRARGFAIDDEERETGVRCVTAPVRDAHGNVIAALSASAPATRFTKKRIASYARQVVSAASNISGRLGYHSASADQITLNQN
ncbi:MAG: IclR family transcriptional regulator [Bythopirellula sp.]